MRRHLLGSLLTVALLAACGSFSGTDAPASAGADAAAADAGTFCSTVTATFCADFDTSTDVAQGWDMAKYGAGKLAPDSTVHGSTPRSLHAIANGATATYLEKTLTGVTTSFTVEADLYFQDIVKSPASAGTIQLEDTPGGDIMFFVDSVSARFQFTSSSNNTANDQYSENFMPTLSLGMWHHVTIAFNAASGLLDANVDGKSFWTSKSIVPAWGKGLTVRVGLPALYETTGIASDAWIDNVVVTVK